jgi:hypothetical protein
MTFGPAPAPAAKPVGPAEENFTEDDFLLVEFDATEHEYFVAHYSNTVASRANPWALIGRRALDSLSTAVTDSQKAISDVIEVNRYIIFGTNPYAPFPFWEHAPSPAL